MTEIPVRVVRVRDEALDIKTFELAASDGKELPPFTPGSHIDVQVADGLVRQYSLCNWPGDTGRYAIAVKREPESRGGSRGMHEHVREGSMLRIGLPRNAFPLQADAGHHLLLAGGIGITPMLSMSRRLLADKAAFDLHYFTRSPEAAAFRDVLEGANFRHRTSMHHGLRPEVVADVLERLFEPRPADGHAYLCGPGAFMEMAEKIARKSWPAGTIHLERFSPAPAAVGGSTDIFDVLLGQSGRRISVGTGQTIVEALRDHGIEIDTSCEQGICGTCLTGVIEGIPDHRDTFLTDDERRTGKVVLPCVSRSLTATLKVDL